MSKLYQLNRMAGSPAAGGLFTSLAKGAARLIGKLTQSPATRAAIAAGKKVLANPMVQTGLVIGGVEAGTALLSGGGGRGGASGGWTRRRRKGITATELRGFRKVASLLHKEGMTIKHHRRGK